MDNVTRNVRKATRTRPAGQEGTRVVVGNKTIVVDKATNPPRRAGA